MRRDVLERQLDYLESVSIQPIERADIEDGIDTLDVEVFVCGSCFMPVEPVDECYCNGHKKSKWPIGQMITMLRARLELG
jgi:hypothetical protein